jgi:hypothetical protein
MFREKTVNHEESRTVMEREQGSQKKTAEKNVR